MKGKQRREEIRRVLKTSLAPIKGTDLASMTGVSRQVIVQDVALLRASGVEIISTAEGYVYFSDNICFPKRTFKVKHIKEHTDDEIRTIIENGGKVLNVFIKHPVHGEISANLDIVNREQMTNYVKLVNKKGVQPLMSLTENVHYHTIEAKSARELDKIEEELKRKGFIME